MPHLKILTAVLSIIAITITSCSNNEMRNDNSNNDAHTDSGPTTGDKTDSGSELSESCRLVDVVFTVDASSSMIEEYKALRDDVFPAFAEHLANISQGLDNFRFATMDSCPNPPNFHTRGNTGECNFSTGKPWIDNNSPNMNEEFACVGDIYLDDIDCSGDDDDEQPITAFLKAMSPPYSENENAGFLRDDALLVVIAVTDEDEQPTVIDSPTSAHGIFEALANLKGGKPERIVFMGVGGSSLCTGLYGEVDNPATKLKAVTDLFSEKERGVWWDLCSKDPMENGLDAAFKIIEKACDEFTEIE